MSGARDQKTKQSELCTYVNKQTFDPFPPMIKATDLAVPAAD